MPTFQLTITILTALDAANKYDASAEADDLAADIWRTLRVHPWSTRESDIEIEIEQETDLS